MTTGSDDELNSFAAWFRQIAEDRRRRQQAHDELRSSPQFVEQSRRLERLSLDFANTLRSCWLVSTRHKEFVESSFFLRNTEVLIQSALMTAFAIREGFLNPGRRELRFLLELAVQALFTDEQMGRDSFAARREFFKRKVEKKNSVDHVWDLRLDLIQSRGNEFRKYVVSVWATASAYVHPSPRQLEERFDLAEHGVSIGFESVEELRAAVDEVAKAFGICVVLAFHAIGHSFTGDLLVDGLDETDAWSFHRDTFVAAVDGNYDYKHERQSRLAEIQARRTARLRWSAWELRMLLLATLAKPTRRFLELLRLRERGVA